MPLHEPTAHLCAIQSEPLDKDTLPTHKVCNTIIRSQRAFISERFKIIWGLVDNEQGMAAKARLRRRMFAIELVEKHLTFLS